MGLRFVIGRSGSGKTRTCLDEIRDRLRENPDGPPLIMLVPEQATFQTEYELARTPDLSGTIRAQALSFRRLSFRIMQETGGTSLIPINDNGRNMLIYKILRRFESEFQLFQTAADQHGFVERVGDLLTEWKRYGINETILSEYIAIHADRKSGNATDVSGGTLLERKLHDLRLIYREIEQELAGRYLDAEDYLQWMVKGCQEAPILRNAEIWVDGFYGFTPNEFQALEQLMRHADNMTITLCLDRPYEEGERPHELDLFHPAAETYIRLRALAEQNEIALAAPVLLSQEPLPRFQGNPMLAHLERHMSSRQPMTNKAERVYDTTDARCGISLHAAANRRAEVEAVARDMISRAQDGMRWRDFAVMVRNSVDYNDYVEAVFSDYEIPFFLDQKNKVLNHPLIEFIRSALETVVHGWNYEAVFRCIKSEMLLPLDGSIGREALDKLENYVLAAGIDGRRWLDTKRWKPLIHDTLDDIPGEPGRSSISDFERIMESREAIVAPLRRLGLALKKAPDIRAKCEALYRLLDHTDAADRLERWSQREAAAGRVQRSREYGQLWDGVLNLLDQMVELAGDQQVSMELFAGMMEAGLESLKLAAVPPSLDQVLVGSMDRTRSGTIEVCYVLGANDGIMPMRMQEDGVLTEQERERLEGGGLHMAPGVRRRLLDERFLIYNALTAPRKHLWVSYPQADEEGKSMHPSEVIRHLKQMFPGLPEQLIAGDPHPEMTAIEQLSFVAHPRRTLSYLVAKLREWREGNEISDHWWGVFNWFAAHPQWSEKLRILVDSLYYSNEEPSLSGDTALMLYGNQLQASVSRIERFVSCPFQHFAIHGLKLKERRLHRLQAPDIGQLFHAALSKLAGGFGERWGAASEAQIRAQAAATVAELAPRLQSQILLSSSRFQYIARKLTQIVAQAAIILGEHSRRALFQPVGLEIGFGSGGSLPALTLPIGAGRSMEIIGRIDRVDAAETEEGVLLRVMDYKSSATSLRLEEVAHGLSLQMLTYLDVLLTHAPIWLGRPALPAGVLYFHVHNPLLLSANRLNSEEANSQILKRFKLRGMLLADNEVVRMMDNELETGHSELLPVALKKDGAFYGTSSVADNQQWDVLRRSVRGTLGRIGRRIVQGEVSIAPYRMGNKTPCAFCSYKPVCQFDPLFEGNDYIKLGKSGKDDVWQALTHAAAGSETFEQQTDGLDHEGGNSGGDGI
ncbi:helicase-exonuclease AddAB subunit AddB [Paenibacillaceae bacterium]|nr:helicase-exonuclease AddAB subunit AddB [Paenibacillaceae bacterium]